jgi:hypothetical protein
MDGRTRCIPGAVFRALSREDVNGRRSSDEQVQLELLGRCAASDLDACSRSSKHVLMPSARLQDKAWRTMVWFVVRFEGGGITENRAQRRRWLDLMRKKPPQITGFYTTRYVDASDGDAAVTLASALVLKELAETRAFDLSSLVLKVDDICTVHETEADPLANGFSFYSTDD